MTTTQKVKTRFAPSPTGYLHVGGARTALFNYLIARQAGGTFLVRIEDTDRARHDESAVAKICEDLRWLGISWDEGIEVGGERGPYRQSERLHLYREAVHHLLETRKAYYAFETAEELASMRESSQKETGGFRYPRPTPLPTEDDATKARAEGRPVVVRFLCPSQDISVVDENFGVVTIPSAELEDFVIQKADGFPTFYLANVVDDALMGVTLVCRGQEFLDQSWRQHVIRDALGLEHPRLAHLPLIMDMKGRKLSKRDGDVDVHAFRVAGYLPEALVNFIALLGWNPGTDRERFTLDELTQEFSVSRLGQSNARFARDKLGSFNTEAIANATPERLLEGLKDYLSFNETFLPDDDEILSHLLRACKGIRTFADLTFKCNVLFGPDDAYEFDSKAVQQALEKGEGAGYATLRDFRGVLATGPWSLEGLEKATVEYCESKGIGLKKVAMPLRVAVTGTQISPPIFDTLVFLGREKTLARMDRCLAGR